MANLNPESEVVALYILQSGFFLFDSRIIFVLWSLEFTPHGVKFCSLVS